MWSVCQRSATRCDAGLVPHHEPTSRYGTAIFEAYIDFSSVPWRSGVLEPKVKELIYCAFDASATHLYVPGLKLHMKNAIGYGATAAEIMEVLEIVSVIGIHAVTTAAPMLEAALAAL